MIRLLVMVLLVHSLLACAPRRPAKVDEIGTQKTRSSTNKSATKDLNQTTHRVVRGDSLYSIGFRYQIDYKTLASINNIAPPYTIYPNQVIQLKGPANKVVFKPTNNSTVSTQPIVTQQPIIATTEPTTQPTQPNNTATTKPAIKPSAPPQQTTNKPQVVATNPQAADKPEPKTTVRKPAKQPITVVTPTKTDLQWLWPTKGKIRTTFLASNPARKGISIGGQAGQDIKAAEAGVVVYSGNGLLGYGELIIIKHNDAFLSAYGHNKSLKVKEGQQVSRGQVIAELGSSGTNVNNLHFEIRKNGKPVNPLNYVKP